MNKQEMEMLINVSKATIGLTEITGRMINLINEQQQQIDALREIIEAGIDKKIDK